jgi:hypothetical protein
MVGRDLLGMQRKLRRSINVQPRKPRWRVRQADDDEVDASCLVLEPRKMVRPASNLRTNVQLTWYGLVPRSAGRFAEIPPGVA